MKLVWKAQGGGRLIHSPDFGYFLVPVRAETLTNMNTFLNCILAHPSPVPAGFRKCARRKKKKCILSKTFFPSPPVPHPLKSPQDTVNTVNREPWLLFLGIYQVFRITFSVPLIEPRVRRVYGARRYVYDMRMGPGVGQWVLPNGADRQHRPTLISPWHVFKVQTVRPEQTIDAANTCFRV